LEKKGELFFFVVVFLGNLRFFHGLTPSREILIRSDPGSVVIESPKRDDALQHISPLSATGRNVMTDKARNPVCPQAGMLTDGSCDTIAGSVMTVRAYHCPASISTKDCFFHELPESKALGQVADGRQLDAICEQAAKRDLGYKEFLVEALQIEWRGRYQKGVESRLNMARFP